MHGRFLCFSGYVAAGRNNNEGVGLAVRILEIETAEEDSGGSDHSLLERKLLPKLADYYVILSVCALRPRRRRLTAGEEHGEKVEVFRVVDIVEVLGTRVPQRRPVYGPSAAGTFSLVREGGEEAEIAH